MKCEICGDEGEHVGECKVCGGWYCFTRLADDCFAKHLKTKEHKDKMKFYYELRRWYEFLDFLMAELGSIKQELETTPKTDYVEIQRKLRKSRKRLLKLFKRIGFEREGS
ncbi:MAG: hypothetical protein QXF56_00955 [Candidatus Micrarchaeia archaeon]